MSIVSSGAENKIYFFFLFLQSFENFTYLQALQKLSFFLLFKAVNFFFLNFQEKKKEINIKVNFVG